MSPGQGRNNNGLEIGCLVDAASGLLTFTANGKELGTYYQVGIFWSCLLVGRGKTESSDYNLLETFVQLEGVVALMTDFSTPFGIFSDFIQKLALIDC